MKYDLQSLPDDAMQRLLHIFMLQELIEKAPRPQPCSPYFWEGHEAPPKHLALAARLLHSKSKNKVRLHPKSYSELTCCLDTIVKQAEKLLKEPKDAADHLVTLAKSAREPTAALEELLSFADEYYHYYLDGLLGNAYYVASTNHK